MLLSQFKCETAYPLDRNSLSNLKKANANSIELAPGNYRVKIRESNATYGAEAKKFQLEPWALLLIPTAPNIT